MGESFLSDSTQKLKPFLGRSEIQIGILWLVHCLIEGNTAALGLLRGAGGGRSSLDDATARAECQVNTILVQEGSRFGWIC
jgi:hypothetical protein